MWFFNKKPKTEAPSRLEIKTLIVNKSMKLASDESYKIQTGISCCESTPDQFRAFFILNREGQSDLTIYPRQHPMTRERAIKVAYAWANAMQATYDMGIEQKVTELD